MIETLKVLAKNDYVIPTIERKNNFGNETLFSYPNSLFERIMMNERLQDYAYIKNKVERHKHVKQLIDSYLNQEIPTWIYHFGLDLLYRSTSQRRNDFTEEVLGKRRFSLVNDLPNYRLLNNDDFVVQLWHSLILENKENSEWNRNPYFHNVRLLFEADFFGYNYGPHYTEADWIEPKSGSLGMEFKTMSIEQDPMITRKDDSYIEGQILVGPDGGGLRHFVEGRPIHAGSAIDIKFGKGWISGRYEWGYTKDSPIRIHAGNEVIYINEGHTVRIKR